MLGPSLEIDGPQPLRTICMPARYIQDENPVQVAPPPIIPVPKLGEEEALADIAMAFIASSNSSGSSQDPQTYHEAMK